MTLKLKEYQVSPTPTEYYMAVMGIENLKDLSIQEMKILSVMNQYAMEESKKRLDRNNLGA
jgi:hypothetical protein